MDFLNRMNEVIEYIEAHITGDINFNHVSRIVCCDTYQFGRIFSYVVGISLSEYIRRRRLTLAALELQSGESKVLDIALKYGYTSPDSFTRAFFNMHGINPSKASDLGVKLKLYPRISFHITIKGDIEMNYRIEEKAAIKCVGGVYHIPKGANGFSHSWEKFLDIKDEKLGRTPNEVIRDKYKLYRTPLWQVGLAHGLDDGSVEMSIGAEAGDEEYPGFALFEIPAATWAVFSGKGKVYEGFDALFTRIFTEWLPSSGYEQSMTYTVEIYPPGDSQNENYAFEIWVPIKKK